MNGRKWILAVAAVVVIVLLAACSSQGSRTVKSQMETAQQISKMEQDIDARQQEVNALLQQYVREGGQDVGSLVGNGLTPEQTSLLEQKLKNEEGIGYRDLVADILSKQKAVEDMKVRVQNLEKTLPSPVEVSKGQHHADIAMAYLTKEKGLDENTAKKLVQQVNLMDELVPGFKVWNFYNDGVYGTFVTQGDAKVSPYGVIQHAKQTLIAEKNSAITQRNELAKEKDSLTQQVTDLTAKRDDLTQQVNLLQAERQDLTNKVNDLQTQRDDLLARNNSVFYRVGARKSLVQEGAVKASWLTRPTLTKFGEADFPQHLDLRSGDTITFTAQDAGVARISRVKLAPGALFKAGQDYTVAVSPSGTDATLKILNKDKFRAERSVAILVN